MQRYRVGILGATGLVGQNLIRRLEGHPWFELAALAASPRSSGRAYGSAVRWRLGATVPRCVRDLALRECSPEALGDCDLVLSALDAPVAREAEPAFAAAGFAVISNSSAFRQADDVPLLVPEVNAAQLGLLEGQRRRHGGGYVVCNPNCSVAGLVVALAPLHRAFRIRRVVVTTLQAVSGAGAEGPRALDLVDNVLPYIAGEEDKLETEMSKILGEVREGILQRAPIVASAHCHRVAVIDGHLEAVSLETERAVAPEEAEAVLTAFTGDVAGLGLPSAPQRPVRVRSEPDRPQPRLDRDAGGGMAVSVGRVRRCPVLGLKLEVLSHNTVRGAAGGTVLNAELLAVRDLLPRRAAG